MPDITYKTGGTRIINIRNQLKCVLFALNSAYIHTNLAVRLLKSYAEQHGDGDFEIKIIEKNIKDRTIDVLNALVCEKADVYGFSSYIWNISEMSQFAEAVRKLLPSSVIFFGGPEPCPEEYIRISGEGEQAFLQLLSDVKMKNGCVQKSYAGIPLDDAQLEAMAVPYQNEEIAGRIIYYETVRGCPFSCGFCMSSLEHHISKKSVEKVMADLQSFRGRGVKVVKLIDRTFNFSRSRAAALVRRFIEEDFDFSIQLEICANMLDEPLYEALRHAKPGQLQLEIGVQSVDRMVLRECGRADDIETTLANIRMLYELRTVSIHADLICNLPYDTLNSIGEGIDALFGICDELQLGFLKLLWDTKLERERKKYGYISMSGPPYTVIQSSTLSFEENMILRDIAYLIEKYAKNPAYRHTFALCISHSENPFALLRRLREALLRHEGAVILNKSISKLNSVRELLQCLPACCGAPQEEIRRTLLSDFMESETVAPPAFLK